ncbi:MAG: electron transfer flavoprotein subunit alpha/FixB family protein [Candidatus Scalindua sediminis]
MNKPVLAIAEQREGTLRRITFEVIGEARRLADKLNTELNVTILGFNISSLADILRFHSPDKVLVADSKILENYNSEAYINILTDVVSKIEPSIILLGATSIGKDVAPRLAARLKTNLISECISLDTNDTLLTAVRPIYGGKTRATVTSNTPKYQIATLRQNIFKPSIENSSKTAILEKIDTEILPENLRVQIKEIIPPPKTAVNLTEARIIVSGGRGMKAPENFKMLEELANILGGALGVSRPVVDAGWVGHEHHVGLTGKIVTPELYIACGISGAIQHQAGMSTSKCIVAINKDPDAPIFKIADYGIVGDLFTIVPLLTEELKKMLRKK